MMKRMIISALNKIDKLYDDLKKDNFELVESQLQK